MSTPTKNSKGAKETPKQPITDRGKDGTVLEKAMAWFVSLSNGVACPVCLWEPAHPDEAERQLTDHGRREHIDRILIGYPTKDMDAITYLEDEEDATPITDAGLRVSDSHDYHDILGIPQDLKNEMDQKGERRHFASDKNMQRYKDRGMEVVKYEGKDVKREELTLMKSSARLEEFRQKKRTELAENALVGRREELDRRLEAAASRTYNAAVKRGYGTEVARNLAKAAERGLSTGTLNIREGRKQKGS